MYSREVDGAPREFGVSGKLWNGVLVMFDRTSESLWTQLDGRAIQGDDRGRRLEHVPSTFTTWERWRKKHPDTLVLRKEEDERDQSASLYADYLGDPDSLFLERLGDGLGGVGAKDTVFGVLVDGQAVAVTERLLEAEGTAFVMAGAHPVAFLRDPDTGDVVAVSARVGGRLFVPAVQGDLNPTLRVHDAISGEVQRIDELEPLRVDRAFWYAWKRTHPDSLVLTD